MASVPRRRGPPRRDPPERKRDTTPQAVSVLDVDADLAALIPDEELSLARPRAMARLERIQRGPWDYQPLRDSAAFGMLVLEGLVGARVTIGQEAHLEVLGEGDLLRPWVSTAPDSNVASHVDWQVFDAMVVAVLDERFARAVAPWPQIPAGLMHRSVLRARRLCLQLALAGVNRIDERLLYALWHFADRWGRMTPDGVRMRLALTQAELGEVIRAARPSVSTAVNELRRQGAITVERPRCEWVLHGSLPAAVTQMKLQAGLELAAPTTA
jgi:CRP/FNR family cyclic AMP-dependent transcriptional regulator